MLYDTQDIATSISEIRNCVKEVLDRIDSHSVFVTHNKFNFVTKMQSLYNMKFASKLSSTLYEIFLNGAIESELISPGGFELFFKILVTNDELPNQVITRKPLIEDIDWMLDKFLYGFESKYIKSLILQSLNLAGFGGHIVIERSNSMSNSIELISGYTFNLEPSFKIENNVKIEKPYVACIDGFVESVSEIHQLLSGAHETQSSVLLFVRGLTDDVLNTLKVNYTRKTLKVIPIVVKFDLEGVNQLVDVATVCNTDITSTVKGDLITSITLEKLKQIDVCRFTSNKLIIQNSSSKHRVATHLSNLRLRREQQAVDDLSELLDKRIKTLFSSHVVVRLVDDVNFILNSQMIDYSLRAYSSILRSGVTQLNNEQELAATVIATIRTHKSIENQIHSIGVILLPDS